ncbi:hypothetical protein GDO86_016231 [Hymenochirus boettgeri]|uniref:glutathione peroxidase n=1 Tax=Hymenochirus boettgeri TaxID=247094 RepID=A0A8T2K4L9_9PIPI|nr:hypothetical protein GDO86_016231 [Hymenochirus boettgeri]
MAYIAKSFYDLQATNLEGEKVDFNENCKNEEILNSLKYVRPGNGFEPSFTLFQKCDVNGKDTHPKFLIGPERRTFKRYSKNFLTINIEPDIQRLLKLTK